MQTEAAGRYVHSVSDLYAADEVELLLEELRELERPAGRRPEDIQDFEIAGSQTGAGGAGGVGGGGGAWSPDGTVHSWDSHPHYRRTPPPPPARVAPLYCFLGHLTSSVGALRFLVTVCSLCSVWLEYAAGGAALWMLPNTSRLRLLLATALFSLMASSALLFLDISRLVYLFPFNWAKLNAWLYISVGSMYVIASSLVMAAVVSDNYWWVEKSARDMLIASSSFGLIGGLASGATALIYCYRRPPPSSTSALLAAPSPSPMGSPRNSPSPSPSPPMSRRAPTYLPVPVEPDPLPCSSKTPL